MELFLTRFAIVRRCCMLRMHLPAVLFDLPMRALG